MTTRKEDTKLQRYMKERGLNLSYVARNMGITKQGLYYKLRGDVNWTARDAMKFQNITRMTKDEFDFLFDEFDWHRYAKANES